MVLAAGCGSTELQGERKSATEKILASSAALKAAAQVRCAQARWFL